MPTLIPANPIMELRIHYTANAQKCMNVLHYATRDPVLGVEPADVTLSFVNTWDGAGASTWMAAIRAIQSSQVHITRLTGQLIWPTRYLAVYKAVDYVGQQAGSCEVQNIQASIQKFGQLGNRHNIGAFHLGGLPTNLATTGSLTAAAKTLLTNLADELLVDAADGITAAQWIPVILNKESYMDGDKKKWRIIGWTDLWGTEAKDEIRVMYRRTKGVGD